jgi:hypothetical protein
VGNKAIESLYFFQDWRSVYALALYTPIDFQLLRGIAALKEDEYGRL